MLYIQFIPSFFLSTIYWYLSIYQKNKYKSLQAIIKFVSVILLFNPINTYHNIILLLYAIGDVVIIYDQKSSLYFFGLGHYLLIINIIDISSIILIGVSLPFLIKIIRCLYLFLVDEYDLVYLIYIINLTILCIVSIRDLYFAPTFLILSDLSIQMRSESTEIFEWILYYISLILLHQIKFMH